MKGLLELLHVNAYMSRNFACYLCYACSLSEHSESRELSGHLWITPIPRLGILRLSSLIVTL